jgi:hypothetical protein
VSRDPESVIAALAGTLEPFLRAEVFAAPVKDALVLPKRNGGIGDLLWNRHEHVLLRDQIELKTGTPAIVHTQSQT